MEVSSVSDLYDGLKGAVKDKGGEVDLLDADKMRAEGIDLLAYNAALGGTEEVRAESRRLIKAVAGAVGIRSASIQGLYDAMGRGEVSGFTVPAINIRGLTYETARAVFRSAAKIDTTAMIFEIAKSEIGYTDQRPAEYASQCLAAAVKEGHTGPVFLQGDHFQVKKAGFDKDREKELGALRDLIQEALDADFFNIDIDASTLVDLSKPTVPEQQRPNFETTAFFTDYIRGNEPSGVTVSVGGEIGEVGGKNSTEEELRAFMDGFIEELGAGHRGISKISIQTGTSHGGVPLPDGTVAEVKVDFDTIERLSKVAREDYGLSGVVQHGASTLPDDAFHHFVEKGCAEVHLATGFQNMIYDSPAFPGELKEEVYSHIREKHADERKDDQTDEQFIYKTRKKGFGPFKEKMMNLPADVRDQIGRELEERFDLLFKELNCKDTARYVKKHVG